MKLAFLVSSLSRSAGGVFDAARRLAQSLYAPGQRDIEVLGLEDEHTLHDAAAWRPLHPRAFPVRGPRAFGYAPRLSAALDQLGTQCGCVVVNKAAVLAGDAPDLTDLIAKRIAK